jgi:hypothetical protein
MNQSYHYLNFAHGVIEMAKATSTNSFVPFFLFYFPSKDQRSFDSFLQIVLFFFINSGKVCIQS